ncbi:hypothetical protein HRW11_01150 [Streptomyces lunaelactis]|uniref:hypothetical protein n=1 Tax=Streptomyces lunaelactis TaxID=1535768 RepID=UPI001584D4DF|nr:hypothetical protein [Streptomyces lunaelactis]NUK21587.1 hypothetical protein [Streptomyces lunaelactis]NUK58283.1 hypothetical protein [Streptomyces lunaelactis]NUK62752.1 hypothetical protein [Streptomyces lunaelactis]NUL08343.1 hypothetical protein [Streptomyces lunaelactis]NUL21951.1 hypothetical protein [Streptomyces lunaelactis]
MPSKKLPRRDPARWPAEGCVADFEIWWMGERAQIRLKPVDPAYLVEDFDRWVAHENSVAAAQWRQRARGARGEA